MGDARTLDLIAKAAAKLSRLDIEFNVQKAQNSNRQAKLKKSDARFERFVSSMNSLNSIDAFGNMRKEDDLLENIAGTINVYKSEPKRNNGPSKARRYTVGSKSLTLAEWEAHSGIKVGTIRDRIKRGWSIEDAVTRPDSRVAKADLQKELGAKNPLTLTLAPMRRRLETPRPIEPKKQLKTYEYNGVSKTLDQWEDETGICAATINNRLRSGWPIEKALTVKPNSLMGSHSHNTKGRG